MSARRQFSGFAWREHPARGLPAAWALRTDAVIPRGPRAGRPRHDRGAALLAALCFATVLALAIGGYITVCYRSLALSTRSNQGTFAVQLAEAGMEDALWALNKDDWSSWSISGTTATRTISGFSYGNGATGQIGVTIANYDGSAGTRTVTAVGTITLSDGSTIRRTLASTATRAPLFVNAIAGTTGAVKFTAAGTSSVIDSYDSSAGLYTAQTPGYAAVLSSGSTTTSSATVQLTNAQVKGYVATLSTGPSYSTSARLFGPATPGTTKIDSSRISTSPYQPVFEIETPTGAGTSLSNPSGNLTLGTAGASSATLYYSTGINMIGSTKVTVAGPVKLVVSGNFYVGLNGGSPSFEVATTGTLEVFVSGDIAIYGNGMNNLTRAPERMAIYGTNTLTVPDMNTAVAFYGVIYTPYGDYKVLSNNAIYGAIVARNVTFSGSAPVMHYDLNLRNQTFSGVDTPYAMSNWRETSTDGN